MALILDVYEQLEFLGSVGIEGGKLVFAGPEKDYLAKLADEFVSKDKGADEQIKEFASRFNGVTHCRPHGAPSVVDPD